MIRAQIKKVAEGQNLTFDEALEAMEAIMDNQVTPAQTAAYLTALAMKGECIEEITASAMSMRNHAEAFETSIDALEIVGTGGDYSHSFNISTTSAFVAAAAGCKIAKHGNRAASSKSGAADVLEKLGMNLNLSAQESRKMLEEEGFCFLFAQKYHSAMKYVAPVRKEIGIRTIFNILGPLTNPARADRQLLGVYKEDLLQPMAQVLINLGIKRGMSVYGLDGLDEISISGPTRICEINDGNVTKYDIKPEDFGYESYSTNEIVGGTPDENAQILTDILSNKEKGAKRNAVCMNAGAAIYIYGITDTIEQGVRIAEKMIDEGKAKEKLDSILERSKHIEVPDIDA